MVKELSRTTHAGLKRSRFTIETRSRTSDASRQASQHKATPAKNSIPKVSQKFCNSRRFLHCNRCFRFSLNILNAFGSRDKFYINSSRQTQQHVQLIQLDSGFGAPWWPQLTARSKPPVTSTTCKAECGGHDSTTRFDKPLQLPPGPKVLISGTAGNSRSTTSVRLGPCKEKNHANQSTSINHLQTTHHLNPIEWWFTYSKWRFSIAMLNYQRVNPIEIPFTMTSLLPHCERRCILFIRDFPRSLVWFA